MRSKSVDAGSSFGVIDLVKRMVDERAMHVRLWMMIRMSNQALGDNVDRYRTIVVTGGEYLDSEDACGGL